MSMNSHLWREEKIMKRKKYGLGVLFWGLAVLFSCSYHTVVSVKVLKPASIHLQDVKEIAIADFQGQDRSGSQIATLTQAMLMATHHFDIMERDQLRRVLEEQNLSMSGVIDEATAVKVGELLGVDALIFGEVTTYEVEPDKKITKMVKTRRGTGKYRTVEKKDEKTGKIKKEKEEIYEEVWVPKERWVRKGTVAINFRVVDVETGRLLAAHSDSKSYDSEKEKRSFLEILTDQQKALKPEGEIVADLSKDICGKFARMIAPYYTHEKRTIEPGSGCIQMGVKYAKAGLWPEATEVWEQAVEEYPKNSVAHYDLGLAYEIQGMLDMAEQEYKTAVELKQKKLYMEALARIRKAKKEQKKLMEQLEER